MYIFVLLLFYLIVPILIIYLSQRYPLVNKLGAVAIAYGLGMFIGSIGIFPAASDAYLAFLGSESSLDAEQAKQLFESGKITADDLTKNKISALQSNINDVTVAIAIPLLLFSLDLKKWFKRAGNAFFSVVLALVSVVVVVFTGFFIFRGKVEDIGDVSGMLIGIYSGGTPNLAAIASALEVDPTIFIVTNVYDMIVGAFCLLFLITIAQKVFLIFLPPYKSIDGGDQVDVTKETTEIDDYSGMFKRDALLDILKGLGLSILILAVSFLISFLVPKAYSSTVIILSITSLGLVSSLIPAVNRLQKTFQAGMYLIVIFCLVIASMADITSLFKVEYFNLFLYVVYVVFGSLALHVILSMFFKIDADTVIITSTALVYSPPFVPVVAGALKNKEIIISGVTAGMFGYVIGNFLGVFTGDFLAGLVR
jgi:uncharacterized membrane protein